VGRLTVLSLGFCLSHHVQAITTKTLKWRHKQTNLYRFVRITIQHFVYWEKPKEASESYGLSQSRKKTKKPTIHVNPKLCH
jgi:hypothetical protein